MEQNDLIIKDIFDELVKMDTEFYKAKDYKLSKNAFELNDATMAGASTIMSPLFHSVANKIAYNGALFAELKILLVKFGALSQGRIIKLLVWQN